MELVSGSQEGLSRSLYLKVARYRYQLFVERLGWKLQARNGIELDQFDRPDTLYVVAQNVQGDILGCARLLPTTKPYLLGEIFPQLLNGLPPPCSSEVWELSRFASGDLINQSQSNVTASQFASSNTVKLLRASIACA